MKRSTVLNRTAPGGRCFLPVGFYPTREITDLRTYLTDVAGLCPSDDQPRAGDVVELRRSPDGKVMEAWLPCGRRLGRLPPADCLAVGELLAESSAIPSF